MIIKVLDFKFTAFTAFTSFDIYCRDYIFYHNIILITPITKYYHLDFRVITF